jgi:hypothetical protein|tara:strand:+ start:8626 stop:8955 length:330 start_codon:yes stop_codon:yes gene_type:complete
MTEPMTHDSDLGCLESLKQKLNQDTARIRWSSLNQYDYQDAIIQVDAQLDLIEVASEFASDNVTQVQAWMEKSLVAKISEEKVQLWLTQDPELWAVVVSPWILVQNKAE